jgi:hypothetical protein
MKYARRLFGRPEYAKHMSKGASVLKSANVLLFMGMTFDHNETPNSTFNSAASYSTTALAVPLLSVAATTSGILQVLQYRKEMKEERERFDSKGKLLKNLAIMLNKGGAGNPVYEDYKKAIKWLIDQIEKPKEKKDEAPAENAQGGGDDGSNDAQQRVEAPAENAQDGGDDGSNDAQQRVEVPAENAQGDGDDGSDDAQQRVEAPAEEAQDGGDDSGGSAQKQSKDQSKGTEGSSDNKESNFRKLDLEEIYRAAALLEELYDQELVHGGRLIFEVPDLVESTTVRNVSASHAEKSDDGDNSNKQKPSPLQPILEHLEQRGLREKYEDILKFVYEIKNNKNSNIGVSKRVCIDQARKASQQYVMKADRNIGKWGPRVVVGWGTAGVVLNTAALMYRLGALPAYTWLGYLALGVEVLEILYFMSLAWPRAKKFVKTLTKTTEEEQNELAHRIVCEILLPLAEQLAAAQEAAGKAAVANQVEVSEEDGSELEKAQQRAARLEKAQEEAEIRRGHLYEFLGLEGQGIEGMIELKDGSVIAYEDLKEKVKESFENTPDLIEMLEKVERAERVVKHDEIIAKNLSERSSTNMDSFRKNGLFAAYFILAITSAIDFVQKLHGSGFNALGAKTFKKAQLLVGTTYLSPFIFGMVTLHAITQLMNYRHLRAAEAAKYKNAETVKAAFIPRVDITLTDVQIKKIIGAIESNKIDAKTAYMALAAIRELEEHLPTLWGRDAFDLSNPDGRKKAEAYLKAKGRDKKYEHVFKLLKELEGGELDPKTIEAAAATYTLEADRKYNRLALVTAVFIVAQAGSKTIIDTAALLNKLHIININSALLANLSAIAGFSAILGVILFVLKSYPDIKDFVDGLSFGKDTEEQKKEKLAATIVADIWIAGSALTAEEKEELKGKLTENWQKKLVDLIDEQGDYKNYELMINAATEHLKQAQDIEDVNLDNLVKGVKKAVMDELGVHASLSCRKSTLDSFVNDRAHIQNPVVNEGVQH